jgi:hypothetical protein
MRRAIDLSLPARSPGARAPRALAASPPHWRFRAFAIRGYFRPVSRAKRAQAFATLAKHPFPRALRFFAMGYLRRRRPARRFLHTRLPLGFLSFPNLHFLALAIEAISFQRGVFTVRRGFHAYRRRRFFFSSLRMHAM